MEAWEAPRAGLGEGPADGSLVCLNGAEALAAQAERFKRKGNASKGHAMTFAQSDEP